MNGFNKSTEMKRRELLSRLAAAGLMASGLSAFSGCGGSERAGSQGADPASENLGNVSGRVSLSEIGGQGLEVLSAFQDPATVSQEGDFSTTAAGSGAQLLFLRDSAGLIRALTVSVPSAGGALAPLVFSAETTALAWLMMTPGIVTTDPARASQTVALIRSRPGYQGVVDYLAARLPSQSVSDLRGDAQLDELVSAVLLDLAAATQLDLATSERVSARSQAEGQRIARVDVKRGANNPDSPNTPFVLTNNAWRFVSVIRQEFLPDGREDLSLLPVAPFLEQAVQVENNLLPGVNGFSIANIALGQFNLPGSATDRVNLTDPLLGSVAYWIYGPGAGINRLFGQADQLPPSIAESDFGTASLGCSALFYVLMPVVDFATAGLAALSPAKLIENVLKVWDKVATKGLSVANLQTALRTGDADSIKVAVFELIQGIVTLLLGGVAVLFEGAAVGTAALFLEIILTAIGLIMSAFNTLIAVTHWVGLPVVAKIEVPVLEPPGLFFLGQGDGFVVHGVNKAGSVLYSSPADGLVLKKFGQSLLQVSPKPSVSAALNNNDDCVYKDADSGKVIFRPENGVGLIDILPPPEVGDPASFLPLFLNDQPIAAGTYLTAGGNRDAWANGTTRLDATVPFLGETRGQSLNVLARLDPRATSLSLVGFSNDGLLVGNSGVTLKEEYKTPVPFVDFQPIIGIETLDPVLFYTEGLTFNFRLDFKDGSFESTALPSILDWRGTPMAAMLAGPPPPLNATPPPPSFLDLNNQRHLLIAQGAGARIEPGGAITGAQTVLALNDEDEVAGANVNGLQILFSPAQSPLDALVPPGFTNPGGLTWLPRMLRGKFAVVRDGQARFYLLSRPL